MSDPIVVATSTPRAGLLAGEPAVCDEQPRIPHPGDRRTPPDIDGMVPVRPGDVVTFETDEECGLCHGNTYKWLDLGWCPKEGCVWGRVRHRVTATVDRILSLWHDSNDCLVHHSAATEEET